ncbi:MAG: hypothetical protein ACHQ1G_04025, partial [Planctomycetota bacterium]
MRRTLLLLALTFAACGGGGGSGPGAELLAAAQCTGLGLGNLDEVFGEVTGFLAAIGGTLPPNVTYTVPDYSITASFGTLAGSVTSGDDISDGIDPGEAASASWNLSPLSGGTLTGNGTFSLARILTDSFHISGNGSVVDGTCVFNATNVDLDLDLGSSLGPVGSFDFNGVTPNGPILGTMTFDGSSTAQVEALF